MISFISVFYMHNITLFMHTWCEVRNFASQKFRLTPATSATDQSKVSRTFLVEASFSKNVLVENTRSVQTQVISSPTPVLIQEVGVLIRIKFATQV